MATGVLITVCPPGSPPLPQGRSLDTHQRVIKLKSTDVVGWDVGRGQRLRNLSDNSTFIYWGDGKNESLPIAPTGIQLGSKLTHLNVAYLGDWRVS